MPDNCKENSKFPLGQSAGLFSFCFCFIPSIHVLAWCESLAAQPSLAIKEREFKSPTLVMMQQQMCSWVLTHFQPSPCLRIIKLLWLLISKCFGIPAKTQFTSQSLRNLNPGPAMRLIYMFWTGILLVTTKRQPCIHILSHLSRVPTFSSVTFSGWKGRHWSRWHQRRCWWNWSKRKWRTLRASRTNRCKGECPSWYLRISFSPAIRQL